MAKVTDTIRNMVYDALHETGTVDDSTKNRFEKEIADGILYIQTYAAPSATCEPETEYAALLVSYMLYAEAGALDEFRKNYGFEIRSGQADYRVGEYAEAMGYED